jgi:hypothetical protein
MNSSKMSTTPVSSASRRSASRRPGKGGIGPALPTTGSTMIAARLDAFAWTIADVSSMSLNLAVSVNDASAAGTPGALGSPRVATPDPAFTRNESAWPW